MARTSLTLPVNGSKIRELREKRGWHQNELEARTAKRGTRVPRTRLSRIENGRERPTSKQLKTLALVFRVKVVDLLLEQQESETDDMQPDAAELQAVAR